VDLLLTRTKEQFQQTGLETIRAKTTIIKAEMYVLDQMEEANDPMMQANVGTSMFRPTGIKAPKTISDIILLKEVMCRPIPLPGTTVLVQVKNTHHQSTGIRNHRAMVRLIAGLRQTTTELATTRSGTTVRHLVHLMEPLGRHHA